MISIITPVLNEEGYVKPFLAHLDVLEGDFELILVDGGSSDGTVKEVDRYRHSFGQNLKLLEADHGRGIQMNAGARAARGDILLFLHVDCAIERDSLEAIEREISGTSIVGGGFRQVFWSRDLFLKTISILGNVRTRITKTFYGDFGIFLRKDIFQLIGGYDEIPFLEDVELCKKAKKHGRLVQIDRYIFTSPRRFFSKGRVKLTAAFVFAVLLNMVGCRPRFLIRYIVEK